MKTKIDNNVVSVTLHIDTKRAHSHGDPKYANNVKHWNNELVLPLSVNIFLKFQMYYVVILQCYRGRFMLAVLVIFTASCLIVITKLLLREGTH